MTNEEAISHIEYSIKAYQNLIENDTRSGEVIGKDIKGEWKSEKTLADAYMKMIESLKMAIKALEQEPCEDAVSRKRVIILIDEASEIHPYKVVGDYDTYSNYNQGWSDACDWLYANIDGIPPVTPSYNSIKTELKPCEDCVSRQTAIDMTFTNGVAEGGVLYVPWGEVKGHLEKLPPVTPQRPKGKWLHPYKSDIACECSVCHIQMPITEYYHFCPNCGSYNGGGEE